MSEALILVDLQYDFMPGGSLAVAGGDEVVPVANRIRPAFGLVVATQDWHPASHGSFAVNHPGRTIGEVIDLNGIPQILWPAHCVQDSDGAAFHRDLDLHGISKIFQKGVDPGIDSYSGFFDNGHRRSTGLAEFLRQRDVDEVFVMGLATDYCVKFTVLDALQLGFTTRLVEDGCRAVNLQPGDSAAAVNEMREAGATVLQSTEIIASTR